jgi:hypothetical protein
MTALLLCAAMVLALALPGLSLAALAWVCGRSVG